MATKTVIITPEQRVELHKLWFIWGNHGPKSTMANHRFIQCFLEHDEDTRDFFKPDKELIEKVDAILVGKKTESE